MLACSKISAENASAETCLEVTSLSLDESPSGCRVLPLSLAASLAPAPSDIGSAPHLWQSSVRHSRPILLLRAIVVRESAQLPGRPQHAHRASAARAVHRGAPASPRALHRLLDPTPAAPRARWAAPAGREGAAAWRAAAETASRSARRGAAGRGHGRGSGRSGGEDARVAFRVQPRQTDERRARPTAWHLPHDPHLPLLPQPWTAPLARPTRHRLLHPQRRQACPRTPSPRPSRPPGRRRASSSSSATAVAGCTVQRGCRRS